MGRAGMSPLRHGAGFRRLCRKKRCGTRRSHASAGFLLPPGPGRRPNGLLGAGKAERGLLPGAGEGRAGVLHGAKKAKSGPHGAIFQKSCLSPLDGEQNGITYCL